jgi:hypothetical protein
VALERLAMEAKQLPEASSAPSPRNRATGPLGGSHSNPGRRPFAWQRKDHHVPPTGTEPTIVDETELARPRQTHRFRKGEPAQTVSRLRPLRRRALRTLRPFLVRIRARKPWTFLRRLLCGW